VAAFGASTPDSTVADAIILAGAAGRNAAGGEAICRCETTGMLPAAMLDSCCTETCKWSLAKACKLDARRTAAAESCMQTFTKALKAETEHLNRTRVELEKERKDRISLTLTEEQNESTLSQMSEVHPHALSECEFGCQH
jgi:hypothetical protein